MLFNKNKIIYKLKKNFKSPLELNSKLNLRSGLRAYSPIGFMVSIRPGPNLDPTYRKQVQVRVRVQCRSGRDPLRTSSALTFTIQGLLDNWTKRRRQ